MEEAQYQFELANGKTNARGLSVGYLFDLSGHGRKDQNREHVVLAADYELEYTQYEAMEDTGAKYACGFSALNSKQAFRPQRLTRKPFVQGPQTAIVVGPSGDEIFTDKYGRVKVQFHWDRLGKSDDHSSCWMRVSHPWAGKNWGMIAIPRIGQEVVVDFLEGDPDHPLITGRVYNADQMPPYELPANKTQTGIKTRSSTGGSPSNFNEIRFEDKKGSEQLFIHAEKNQDIEVENDETHWVGHDRTKTIDHDETTHVKHDRTETVDNNETITIGVDRTEQVGNNETITIGVNRTEAVGANETITIGANRTETVGANQAVTIGATDTLTVATQRTHTVGANETITVGAAQEITVGAARAVTVGAAQQVSIGADQSIDVANNQSESIGKNYSLDVGDNRSANVGKDDSVKVGKNLVVDAGDSITIKTGSASISMKKDGTIVIKGKDITIEGSGKINAKASSDIIMKGSKILQN
jgi:type VI secretion system secreted protein VgrG